MPASDSSEPEPAGGSAKALWVGALVLVSAATAVLVLSDDARLLRLGLVAALWAALIGAFAVARLRSRLADQDDRSAEQQRIYELELEREVAARREFELEAENEARRRVAEESEDEVQALRAELRTLRESLEQILGGDMLFERVALRAESTRVRSLPEGEDEGGVVAPQAAGRELPAGYDGVPAGYNGGNAPYGRSPANANVDANAERDTELITRLSGDYIPEEAQQAGGQPAGHPAQTPGQPPQTAARAQWFGYSQQAQPERNMPPQQAAPPAYASVPGRKTPAAQGNAAWPNNSAAQDSPAARNGASAQNGMAAQNGSAARKSAGAAGPPAEADPRRFETSRPEQAPAYRSGAHYNPAQAYGTQAPNIQPYADQSYADQSPENRPQGGQTSLPRASWMRQPSAERSGSWPSARSGASNASSGAAGTPAEQAPAERASAERSGDESAEPHPGAHTQGTSVNDLLAVYGESGEPNQRRRRRRG